MLHDGLDFSFSGLKTSVINYVRANPTVSAQDDNAAMIAAAGWHRLGSDGPTSLDSGAYPGLRLNFS